MSSKQPTPKSETSAVPPSPQEQQDFHFDGISQLGTNESASVASSKAPSNRNEHLASLFPLDTVKFSKFTQNALILQWLSEFLKLDASFIAHMECCGYVTPSIIVNHFGLQEHSIAESFAVMGPSHILDPQVHPSSTNLVLFARFFTTAGKVSTSLKESWK